MSSLRIRPRFKEELPISSHTFCQRLEEAIASHHDFTGLVSENYCVLKIAKAARHYWSPQLTLSLEQPEGEENKTRVRGLYGPGQSVWAIFFMSYAALGVLALFAGVIGLSSLMLGKSTLTLGHSPHSGHCIGTLSGGSGRSENRCRTNVQNPPLLRRLVQTQGSHRIKKSGANHFPGLLTNKLLTV